MMKALGEDDRESSSTRKESVVNVSSFCDYEELSMLWVNRDNNAADK